MAHIQINDETTVKSVTGEIQNAGTVLCIKSIQYIKPSKSVKVTYDSYIDSDSEGGLKLENVLNTNQVITLTKEQLLKGVVPLVIDKIKTDYSLTDVVDLVLSKTPWHTEDLNGNPIDLEVRTRRVFLTWRQATTFARLYNSLVDLLIQVGIPIVEDDHGQWMYFEYIDDPTDETKPVETILINLGAYIEPINI